MNERDIKSPYKNAIHVFVGVISCKHNQVNSITARTIQFLSPLSLKITKLLLYYLKAGAISVKHYGELHHLCQQNSILFLICKYIYHKIFLGNCSSSDLGKPVFWQFDGFLLNIFNNHAIILLKYVYGDEARRVAA
jgi:hypothetical protein